MNVLQLTSDWKWTGPAEPMVRLARGLADAGHEVCLACPRPPDPGARSVAGEAERAGVGVALELERGRGARPLGGRTEVARLAALLEERRIEVVHAWHTRDHVLALRAAARRRRRGATVLVRSWRKAEAPPATPWNRWLLGPGSDGVLCVSPGTALRMAALRGGRAVRGAFGAVDVGRLAPRPAAPGTRKALGLEEDARVVGVVARVQRHRRFDLLLEAARRWFRLDPRARLLVVGRGTHRAEVAEEPARRLGIADRVVFAGYRDADYTEVLRSIDVLTFLVPGSDGTCRALLEAAACGIPAVTTRRGSLPEIVADGETGLLVDEDAGALAGAWRTLFDDEALRRRFGAAAHARAAELFTPERMAREVTSLYAEARAARRR